MAKIIMALLIVLFSSLTGSEESKLTIKAKELQRFPLKAQVPAMNGYDIRARKIMVLAGATISEHSHTDRAGIVYVESGEIVEYRGNSSRILKAGDSLVEDADTVHSYKNISKSECVLIAFDIPVSE